jgi:glycolate oxidase
VVRSVVEKTGGRILPLTIREQQILMVFLFSSCYVHRVFRPALGNVTTIGVMDSFALLPKVMSVSEELFKEDSKPGGAFGSANPEGTWAWPTEGRHMWCENLPTYRGYQPRSYAAALRYFMKIMDYLADHPIGINAFVGGAAADLYGPMYSHANDWMRKIKNRFDPKNLSDASMYITPKRSPMALMWPIVRRILFARPFAPLLKKVTLDMVRKGPN